MTDTTFHTLDLTEVKHRYDELLLKVQSFLQSNKYPSVKSHMIQYVTNCSNLESDLISLKSEIAITRNIADVDYKSNLKSAYSSANRFDPIQKWQSDIVVHGEASVIDSKKVVDCLESMYTALDEYKWLLKSSRELAAQYYRFLSGDE